jgi:energy-coupled thiamine transporter ThiT
MKKPFSIYEVCEIALLVAMAVALDILNPIKINAGGGNVGIAMIPLFVIALRNNIWKSFIATGIVFGVVTYFTDGWGGGFYSIVFDYVLAFGSLAILSLFRNLIFKNKNKVLPFVFITMGLIAGGFGRYVFTSISSIINYGSTFSEALAYNLYIPASILICIVVINALYPALVILNRRFPTEREKQIAEAEVLVEE